MPIHWFPGHMNRARREIADALKNVDVVIELVDARLPFSSRNPLLGRLAAKKPIQTLLSKADLADPDVTEAWLEAWPGPRPLALSMIDAKSVRPLLARCRELAPHRGGPGRTLRTMVVGIPNVGKSTLFNALTGRRVAKTGDKPAITRHAQRVELDRDLSIFDSPGVLWPRLDDQEGAHRLAASGAVGDAAFDPIEVACWAVRFVSKRYASTLVDRFDLGDELDAILRTTPDDPKDASVKVILYTNSISTKTNTSTLPGTMAQASVQPPDGAKTVRCCWNRIHRNAHAATNTPMRRRRSVRRPTVVSQR